MRQLIWIPILLSFSWGALAQSQSEKEMLHEAVQKTQSDMSDRKTRKTLIDTPAAKKADSDAKALLGEDPKMVDEIYSISADILPHLADAGGSPEKMAELAEKIRTNPQAFFDSLTPEQKKRIQELAKKIENKGPKNSPGH